MIPFTIFTKMRLAIKEHVAHHERGLYLYIVFPIAVSFLITFIGSRILNHLLPDLYIPWPIQEHVHHFAYGFFVLAISGYLALVFSGPKAKYWISLLYGFGLGLAFDEYALWLNLKEDQARWNYDGFLIIVGTILVIITARPGIKFMKNHLPFIRSGSEGGA